MADAPLAPRPKSPLTSDMSPKPRWLPLLSWLILAVGPLAASDSRLNILFVFADDWGRYASAYRGLDGRPTVNDVIKTPNVDRVAREGVLFRNAFATSPSCTPCRSALLSGRYFFQTGRAAILNGAVWDETIPSFPLLLRDAGYHIGKSFKVWSPGTPADAPFGRQEYAYQSAGNACNNFSEESTAMVESGMTVAAAREKILGQVRGNFDSFLAARKAGQPWHYFLGTTTTHRAWTRGSGKALWGIEPDSLKGKLPKFLPDVAELREDVADYLGECQAVDAYVGVLLKRLEEIGELDKTVVVLSGDHGMPGVTNGKCNLYDHGSMVPLVVRWPGAKAGRVVDDLVRLPDLMPTFLEIGGAKIPENLYGKSIVSLIKSDRAGRIDPTRDWVIVGRERHVWLAREGNLPYPMRALRTPDFLYVRNFMPDRWPMGAPGLAAAQPLDLNRIGAETRIAYADMDASPTKTWLIAHQNDAEWKWHVDIAFAKRPGEELYDLKNDPDQIKNLAADPAFAAKKKELADRLMKTLTAAGDPRVTGDGSTYDKSPFTDAEQPAADGSKKKGKKKAGE
ncbi:MAG: sulfatase [Verrucomicrobia bacterium]|nr:sulfatase [Verrucomicrobiota bacterium]